MQYRKSDLIVEVVQISRNKYMNVTHNLQHVQTLQSKVKITTVREKAKKKSVFTSSDSTTWGSLTSGGAARSFPTPPSPPGSWDAGPGIAGIPVTFCRAANHKTTALSTSFKAHDNSKSDWWMVLRRFAELYINVSRYILSMWIIPCSHLFKCLTG